MLQVANLREDKANAVKGLLKRNIENAESLIDGIIALDDKRKALQTELDSVLAESNQISKSIGVLMKEGKKEEAEKVKTKTAELKQRSKILQEESQEIEKELMDSLYQIPNVPHEDVKKGKGEDDNEILSEHGKKPELYSGKKPHWDLIKDYDIIDFDLGIKITGAGFPVYKGKGARMQRALLNFFLDEAEKQGFKEIQPPVLVNEASGIGTGQLPDKEGQMYHIEDTDLYLIPTAEVPITNLLRDEIINEEDLPIKLTAYTPCFRKEAGSWGAHVRGLNRLHQFDKVEIVQVLHPDKSYQALEEMSSYIQSLLTKLELPYRVLRLCGGDLGFTSALTYDMEVWSAAQEKWLEVSSVSNFETYQSNRLKLRYKDADKKKHLLHTLNGSALAFPRILAAILENNQTEKGIRVPKVLQSYTGFEWID
ncbi:serine--tRNA ligase [Marivirga tractuosa]|uniref:Serine--tRNA ligase n=1 Tax=Marivirga tractuosa (strain ATCC 23168 / DSM 4126 / NBRC 15989 / NCIMB 1408 / VKM B-1430 / H-43) TaxID=643867 RepID=E4TRR8_MARTH|nr:serine--tRNA ligase [Marivirga tractuosa]ADR22767.1 seryl-tRNA synthetase [Marivirga tractuosa DSM 4126]BDD16562.1 serine--tRNA ligase [Marivirga tractuosa]